jgi:cytochrome P450
MKIALHVITGAGFGVPFAWDKSSEEIPENHTMSFVEAVDQTLHHLVPLMLIPRPLLKLPIDYFRVTLEAYHEFGRYMKELLEREKMNGKETDTPNLLSVLAKHAKLSAETGEKGLSDDEIIGNTFIFLIGGHETRYSSQSAVFRLISFPLPT